MDSSDKKKYDLFKKLVNEQAFWSYQKPSFDQLTDEVLIELVIIHLDSDEIDDLFQIYNSDYIKKIWEQKVLTQEPYYHSLNRLMAYKYFGINNPDEYIKQKTSSGKLKTLNNLKLHGPKSKKN
ncbi:MAG: hypothetical protein ACOC10_04975 [Bacteroidota bacterium]